MSIIITEETVTMTVVEFVNLCNDMEFIHDIDNHGVEASAVFDNELVCHTELGMFSYDTLSQRTHVVWA